MRKIVTVSWPLAQTFKPAKGLSHHTKRTRRQVLLCLPKVKITQKPCWQSLLVFLSPRCMSLFNLLQTRNAGKKMFWEQVKITLNPLHYCSATSFNNCKTWYSSWVPISARILRVPYSFLILFFCSRILYLLALMFSSMKLPSCSSVRTRDQDAVFKAELGMHSENVARLIFAKKYRLPIHII